MFPEAGESETILVDILKFFPTFSFLMSLWAFLIFPNQQKSPNKYRKNIHSVVRCISVNSKC